MDAADVAQGEQDAELEGKLSAAVSAARAALAAPGDEICADCGGEIPPRRRAAMPSAIRCIECQAFAERVGKAAP